MGISAMSSALDQYGLPMPQFRRIGGILADELPVDDYENVNPNTAPLAPPPGRSLANNSSNQKKISSVNLLRDQAVKNVNKALEMGDPNSLIHALKDSTLGIGHHIWDFAGNLYMDELNYVRHGCKSDIRYEGIKKLCEFLSIIAEINYAIEQNNSTQVWSLAASSEANIEDL